MADETLPRPKHKLRVPRARRGKHRILVGTRKGVFVFEGDADRKTYEPRPEPWHLGSTVFHAVVDPRNKKQILCAVRTPDGEPTVMASDDGGKRWRKSVVPPRFDEETGGDAGPSGFERAVHQVFWLSPGHAQQPGTWYAGTVPQGLFRTDDHGRTWEPVRGLHHHPEFDARTRPNEDRTPDGPKLHSVLVDPRDADHLVIALSSGGVLESLDGGADWHPLGDVPEEASNPKALCFAPTNPDVYWMQGHRGVWRLEADVSDVWERVGPDGEDGASEAGFPIVCHPGDPDTAWVVPMDDGPEWPRTSVDGRPALYRTQDGGASWKRQDKGLPKDHTWWTVKRQCLAVDGFDPLGLVFGTASGELWASRDEGKRFHRIASGLPHVYSVEIG